MGCASRTAKLEATAQHRHCSHRATASVAFNPGGVSMFHRIFSSALPAFRRSAADCRLGIGLWALALLLLVLSTHAVAAKITFAWDPIPDQDLAGYKLYHGYASGQYNVHIDA